MVARGCSVSDRFHRGNPLWVVNHFNDLDWCKLWAWVKMRWQQVLGVKKTVVVVGIGPGFSHGIARSWEAMRWLGLPHGFQLSEQSIKKSCGAQTAGVTDMMGVGVMAASMSLAQLNDNNVVDTALSLCFPHISPLLILDLLYALVGGWILQGDHGGLG